MCGGEPGRKGSRKFHISAATLTTVGYLDLGGRSIYGYGASVFTSINRQIIYYISISERNFVFFFNLLISSKKHKIPKRFRSLSNIIYLHPKIVNRKPCEDSSVAGCRWGLRKPAETPSAKLRRMISEWRRLLLAMPNDACLMIDRNRPL